MVQSQLVNAVAAARGGEVPEQGARLAAAELRREQLHAQQEQLHGMQWQSQADVEAASGQGPSAGGTQHGVPPLNARWLGGRTPDDEY